MNNIQIQRIARAQSVQHYTWSQGRRPRVNIPLLIAALILGVAITFLPALVGAY